MSINLLESKSVEKRIMVGKMKHLVMTHTTVKRIKKTSPDFL